MNKINFDVFGMSCAACSARVEGAVSKLDGVRECQVNLLANSMTVEGDASIETIIDAVEKAGYSARIKGAKESKNDNNSLQKRHIIDRILRELPALLFCFLRLFRKEATLIRRCTVPF